VKGDGSRVKVWTIALISRDLLPLDILCALPFTSSNVRITVVVPCGRSTPNLDSTTIACVCVCRTEFYGLELDTTIRALQALETDGKCAIIQGDAGDALVSFLTGQPDAFALVPTNIIPW
jgi:hypothetical protein